MKRVQQVVTDYVEANNMTKDAFASKLGFGRSAFFSKLRGSSEFTLTEAFLISRELGCTLDDFYAMATAEQ